MTVLNENEVEDFTTDFMGNTVEKGSLIVYATLSGSSPRLTLAEVLEVKVKTNGNYRNKYRIRVQPLEDSTGHRWSNYKYNEVEKKMKFEGEARPVTLQFRDRLMVIT